ncbi:methylated-DNA--[protein]-cysteine S-methyltransferase [Gracilibacillus oryzae]|uniref:Methylated-DNA--protein-cysteine methyltransferase n=2 Tax=Gracilibacillus oryzae TaxID=1672701 RepID=A0A7C8KQK2_9BACI|nr:methylated-DNA--[protein]-cysteine S-methyltransferase [Gracilibacillus oryzae]
MEMKSPIGQLTIVGENETIFALEFGSFAEKKEKLLKWCQKHELPTIIKDDQQQLASVQEQITEYFKGERVNFSLKYVLFGTEFQKKVWNALLQVPYGQTRSYKQIAESLQSPKAVRAVGGANNKNPISIIIPCHRVIGANGNLVGYGGGLDKKTYLLEFENRKG